MFLRQHAFPGVFAGNGAGAGRPHNARCAELATQIRSAGQFRGHNKQIDWLVINLQNSANAHEKLR
jgi:hypothetical protein